MDINLYDLESCREAQEEIMEIIKSLLTESSFNKRKDVLEDSYGATDRIFDGIKARIKLSITMAESIKVLVGFTKYADDEEAVETARHTIKLHKELAEQLLVESDKFRKMIDSIETFHKEAEKNIREPKVN